MPARALRMAVGATAALLVGAVVAQPSPDPVPSAVPRPARAAPWVGPLEAELAALDRSGGVRLGAWVRDLDSGEVATYRADASWYWASMVKVPVAVAVLRAVERGDITLDTAVTLRASDYVDGAGPARHQKVGAPLSVRWLVEQMIVWSDNTATDVLIHLVDVAAVNAVVDEVLAAWPAGSHGEITTLGEVRRRIYGGLFAGADRLGGRDLMVLRDETGDAERLLTLKRLLGPAAGRQRLPNVQAAYDAYYAAGANSGRLDAYGELLVQLVDGRLLGAEQTRYLLDVMGRVQTGKDRIRAGLPAGTSWAHKTGTQRRRVCDAGLVRAAHPEGRERRLVVVACTRDGRTVATAESLLRRVGLAVCRSGALADPSAPSARALDAAATCPPDDDSPAASRSGPAPGARR